MKGQTIKILLVALVVINIIDGDFQNPSVLDIIKFILLAVCLILSFVKGHENESERNQNK